MAIGAAAAPSAFVPWRLGAALGAFLLALGIGCHALDELAGRPLATRLSRGSLVGLAVTGLGGAVLVGLAGAVTVSPRLIPLVALGAFLALAYNLELFGGHFHNDLWFALAWGGFPAFTGWFVETASVNAECALLVIACCLLATAQRRLSTPARELRRQTIALAGRQTLRTGQVRELDSERLLAPLEGALAALSVAMVALAVALVVGRL